MGAATVKIYSILASSSDFVSFEAHLLSERGSKYESTEIRNTARPLFSCIASRQRKASDIKWIQFSRRHVEEIWVTVFFGGGRGSFFFLPSIRVAAARITASAIFVTSLTLHMKTRWSSAYRKYKLEKYKTKQSSKRHGANNKNNYNNNKKKKANIHWGVIQHTYCLLTSWINTFQKYIFLSF